MAYTETSIKSNQLGLTEKLIAAWPIAVGILVGIVVVGCIGYVLYRYGAHNKVRVYKKDMDRERKTVRRQTLFLEEEKRKTLANF